MDIKLIAGVSENGVIGVDGELPWHFPEDLAHFRRETMGSVVIMGRVTFENIVSLNGGEPLEGRDTVVLTRQGGVRGDSFSRVHVAGSVKRALAMADNVGNGDDVYVAGGGSVYDQFISRADELVLTEVDMVIENGDTSFPSFSMDDWEVVDEETGFDGFDICWYRRVE